MYVTMASVVHDAQCVGGVKGKDRGGEREACADPILQCWRITASSGFM